MQKLKDTIVLPTDSHILEAKHTPAPGEEEMDYR